MINPIILIYPLFPSLTPPPWISPPAHFRNPSSNQTSMKVDSYIRVVTGQSFLLFLMLSLYKILIVLFSFSFDKLTFIQWSYMFESYLRKKKKCIFVYMCFGILSIWLQRETKKTKKKHFSQGSVGYKKQLLLVFSFSLSVETVKPRERNMKSKHKQWKSITIQKSSYIGNPNYNSDSKIDTKIKK